MNSKFESLANSMIALCVEERVCCLTGKFLFEQESPENSFVYQQYNNVVDFRMTFIKLKELGGKE